MNSDPEKKIKRMWLPIVWLIASGSQLLMSRLDDVAGWLVFVVGLVAYFLIYYKAE